MLEGKPLFTEIKTMETPVVGTLLDSFDHFNRFKVSSYYTVCFGILPSSLKIDLPIEGSQEKVEVILKSLELEEFKFVSVFKNWRTADFQNAEPAEDYAYEFVFKSAQDRMLIHVAAHEYSLHIGFYYDINHPQAEAWILATHHRLRSTFGSPKMPKFEVLVFQDGTFSTEDVSTGDFQSIDIGELYNDDFAEIDELITSALPRQESGIILLHGESGTGKTTYIKHLICRFKDLEFIFVQNDFVRDLLKPSFISFLIQHKNSILIIEDAEKVVIARENSTDDSVVSTILQLTDGLFSDFLNIKIICTFNTELDRIDRALLRKGRMIAKYHFSRLSAEKTAELARKLGHDNVTGSLTLADIFEFEKQGFQSAVKKAMGFLPS
jgi:hypothetical protein